MGTTGTSWKKGEATDKALQTILAIGTDINIPENMGMLDVLGIEPVYKTRQLFRNYINTLEKRGQIKLERYKVGSQHKISRIRVVKAPNPVVVEKEKVAKQIAKKVVIEADNYLPELKLDTVPLLRDYMTNSTKIQTHIAALKDLGVEIVTDYESNPYAEEGIKLFQYCMELITALKSMASDATMQLQSLAMQRDNLQIENSDAAEKLAKWYGDTPMNGKAVEDTKSDTATLSVDSSASRRVPNQNERPVV